MLPASSGFLLAMQTSRNFLALIECDLTDGTILTLTNADIRMGSMRFSKASSSDSTFDIGSFIVGRFDVTLNNIDSRFSAYDFDGAVLTVQLGLGAEDPVQVGVYTVTDTSYNSSWITLTCYDNGLKFQRDLAELNLSYPMTGSAFVTAVCTAVGVTASSIPASLASITIRAMPEGVEPNMLQAVAWAAMMAGCNARITPQGGLAVDWYDTATLSSTWSDIEADGWDEADVYELTGVSSTRISLSDIVITGVTLAYTGADGAEVTIGTGTDEYMINLSQNPFVNVENAAAVLANLGTALIGLRFRPCEVVTIANPLIEPGDIVRFKDRRGANYLTILTHVDFTIGSFTSSGCGAEDPRRHAVVNYSAAMRSIQKTRAIAQEATRIAGSTQQHFWNVTDGDDTGARITEISQDAFLADPENGGPNLLARSNGIAVRNGLTELATFGADGVVVGAPGQSKAAFSANRMDMLSKIGISTFAIDQAGTQEETRIVKTLNDQRGITGVYPNSYNRWVWSDAVAGGKVGGSLAVSIIIASSAYSITQYLSDSFTIGTTETKTHNVANNVPCHVEVTYDASGSLAIKIYKTSASSGAYWMILRSVSYDGYIAMPVYSIGKRADGTQSYGPYSAILGEELIGSGPRQTVIGKYNVEDSNGNYVFIIGNGSSSARSNALGVKWDGSIDTAKGALAPPTISTVTGSSVSLANATPGTVASVALKKGCYILTGCVQYASNATGNRALRFSTTDGGASADACGAIRMPATSGARTVMAHTWPCQIDTDGTTIYLVGSQDSGGALTAYRPTIKIVALDGGGVYTEG